MNIYYYLFYKIYVFTKKLGNYNVAFSAVLGMSFLLILNLAPIVKILGVNDSNFTSIKPTLLVLGLAVIFINEFIFMRKKKYRSIIKSFSEESERSRIIGNVVVTLYVMLTFSIILFF